FKMQLRAASREALETKFRDLIDRGVEIRVKADDLQVTGSPLLEEIVQKSGAGELRLKWGNEFPSSLEVMIEGDTPHFFQMDGPFHVGQKFGTFEGKWLNAPVKVTFEVPI